MHKTTLQTRHKHYREFITADVLQSMRNIEYRILNFDSLTITSIIAIHWSLSDIQKLESNHCQYNGLAGRFGLMR